MVVEACDTSRWIDDASFDQNRSDLVKEPSLNLPKCSQTFENRDDVIARRGHVARLVHQTTQRFLQRLFDFENSFQRFVIQHESKHEAIGGGSIKKVFYLSQNCCDADCCSEVLTTFSTVIRSLS
jgi:hypothetical protein